MADITTASPAVSYLLKPNIVHPRSEAKSTEGLARVTALEAAARAELATRLGVSSVSGGAILRHP